jgi:hypothetical protein
MPFPPTFASMLDIPLMLSDFHPPSATPRPRPWRSARLARRRSERRGGIDRPFEYGKPAAPGPVRAIGSRNVPTGPRGGLEPAGSLVGRLARPTVGRRGPRNDGDCSRVCVCTHKQAEGHRVGRAVRGVRPAGSFHARGGHRPSGFTGGEGRRRPSPFLAAQLGRFRPVSAQEHKGRRKSVTGGCGGRPGRVVRPSSFFR